MVTNTLKIMGAMMLLLATSNGVGVNVRLVGYGLSVSRYQGIFTILDEAGTQTRLLSPATLTNRLKKKWGQCKEASLQEYI